MGDLFGNLRWWNMKTKMFAVKNQTNPKHVNYKQEST